MKNARVFPAFLAVFVLCATALHAAPLQYGFYYAPSASASPSERADAFNQARGRLLAVARAYEGTPYRLGGTTRSGMDCSGFVYRSFREALGVSLPRTSESMFLWAERIRLDEIQPGDLVFFRTGNTARITHVGIYTGNGSFIHSASQGRVTGVIFSRLDEPYWTRTYAGAGRVLPRADNAELIEAGSTAESPAELERTRRFFFRRRASEEREQVENRMLIGFAAAPTWNTVFPESGAFRGIAGHFLLGTELRPFGQPMILGFELRPEWDRMLGVFRLPFTLSWGLNDSLRFFAGPALSFGSAAISAGDQVWRYTGGTSWFGTAGLSAAPFTIRFAGTEFSPYGEIAWQSFYSDKADTVNLFADMAAGLRFSTGLRFTWRR